MTYELDLIQKISIINPALEVIGVLKDRNGNDIIINGRATVECKLTLGAPQAKACEVWFNLAGFVTDGTYTTQELEDWVTNKMAQFEV